MPIRLWLFITPTVQEAGESGRAGTLAAMLLQAGVQAVTGSLSSAPPWNCYTTPGTPAQLHK